MCEKKGKLSSHIGVVICTDETERMSVRENVGEIEINKIPTYCMAIKKQIP